MKILYISQYFPPEIGAPAARVSELSRHWVEGGHAVTVLTGFPNYPTGVVPDDYRGKLWHFLFREKFEGVNVVRSWLWPSPNRKALGRMVNFLSFALSAAVTGLFLSRPDVVIATSPQLLVGLSGWWLARCKRVPYILEVRDLWPESLEAVGMGNSKSPLHRILAKVAGFLYRHSDHIVVVTNAFKERLIEDWRVPSEKISVVENGVETDLFSSRAPSVDLRRALGADGKFLACYIGAIGMAHGLETLLEAAKQLQIISPQIMLLLVGEGAEKERILSQARADGLTNLRILDQQPRKEIPAYIQSADACLVLLRKTPLFKTVIPTKMLEYMSCGKPLILAVDGQAREIVESAGAGIYVEPGDAGQLAVAIKQLADDPLLCKSLGENGRRHVLQHFSRKQKAKEYLVVLNSVLVKAGEAIKAEPQRC